MNDSSQTIIISLGGSMVVPDAINTELITDFFNIINVHRSRGVRFYVIVGGGKTARTYQQGLRDLGTTDQDDLDWIGLYATHLNAELVRLYAGDDTYESVVKDPTQLPTTNASLIVCGGWKPGWSTDYVAVTIAQAVGAQYVANLSNVAYVYSDDPRTNPDAEKFTELSWQAYLDIIPKEWNPGMSAPFDPVASRLASEHALSVAVLDGNDLERLDNFLNTGDIEGTLLAG